jgi:outer membrane protein assembly factor BamD (BamD/ComL family)
MRRDRIGTVGWCVAALPLWAVLAAGSPRALAQEEYEWKDGNWVKVASPAKGTPAGECALIRQYVQQGSNRTAVREAERFLKKYPLEPSAEEVLMLAGRAEIARGRYFQAYEWFERQLNQFPNGPLFERALIHDYEVAEAFLAGKKRIVWGIFYLPAQDDGLLILAKIAEHAPGSALAEKSLMRIGDYHYQERDYAEAVQAYDRYLEVFARAERASYAMLQAARASLASYRGTEFDDTPLLEARQRYQMFSQRFPLQADRADVPRILEQIRVSLARKAYTTAEFYERTGRRDPAQYYYRLVMEQYPQTEWEARSASALRRLGVPTALPGAATIPASAPAASGAERPAPASMSASAP